MVNKMDSSYYAVIFTSQHTETIEGYDDMSETMETLAKLQPGYLGIESARSEIGITVSYWENLEAIKIWKANLDHKMAQKLGRKQWYAWYKVRICKVERAYEFLNS